MNLRNGNGFGTMVVSFLTGAGVVLFGALITLIITFGGERERVLGYINRTEPLDAAAVSHRTDAAIHVSVKQAAVIEAIPIELEKIHNELDNIKRSLARLEGRR
jgi:hypothetical protein